jgi:ankyrin repeat protein
LDYGAEINILDQANMTPLHAACLSGQPLSIIQLLLAAGADPNLQDHAVCIDAGWTPLHHLASGVMYDEKGLSNIALLLLKSGADPSIRGRWLNGMGGTGNSTDAGNR